jgi:hypothetical protein
MQRNNGDGLGGNFRTDGERPYSLASVASATRLLRHAKKFSFNLQALVIRCWESTAADVENQTRRNDLIMRRTEWR